MGKVVWFLGGLGLILSLTVKSSSGAVSKSIRRTRCAANLECKRDVLRGWSLAIRRGKKVLTFSSAPTGLAQVMHLTVP